MSEYGNDFVTVLDEDGNELTLEHLGTINREDTVYMAFVKAADQPEELLDADMELIILRVAEEDGEEILMSIEDEQEYDAIYEIFVAELNDLYDAEEEDTDDPSFH